MTDMGIFSLRRSGYQVAVCAESWPEIFDATAYAYILTALLIFCACFTATLFSIEMRLEKKPHRMRMRKFRRKLRKHASSVVWNSTLYLIGQFDFDSKMAAPRLLILSITLFVFFLVDQMFMNSMSANMVAKQPLPYIDTIEDFLYDDSFDNLTVSTMEGL